MATQDYPLLYVEWEDISSSQLGWEDLCKFRVEPVRCHSIGWQIHEDEDRITIASGFNCFAKKDEAQYSLDTTIPRGCIIRMENIEPYTLQRTINEEPSHGTEIRKDTY